MANIKNNSGSVARVGSVNIQPGATANVVDWDIVQYGDVESQMLSSKMIEVTDADDGKGDRKEPKIHLKSKSDKPADKQED